ncbi:iron ABC transporter permease [Clostridium sardiniense]|uniref:Iron ABC transporter permease n=1 Tax=Clostridium sardiniense TaxID=29369 RepID=A0ABS7KY79_CLOSR|nr:iron ABC transporter permease [Clostridium sardiniense]MBM7835198.1 iron complex transport system permease protein [Clostridium sardiniense]MBY0755607.1 iron ABC transporter permease [Clostridium sardiniense]MDQ0460996.1 iron complex transport system permease protein [Clostridium sardiniense]
MNIKINRKRNLAFLTIPIVFLVICIGTSIGSSNINLFDIFSIIGNKLVNIPLKENVTGQEIAIIWELRFPRVLLAFLVGGALAVSGAVVQSVLKNPLASPYTLGISSGAGLGAALVMIFGVNIPLIQEFSLPIVGFIFGLFTVIIVIAFAKRVDKLLSNNTIILAGMVFSLFLNAILTTIGSMHGDSLKAISLWQMGSFSMKGWSYVKVFIPFLLIGIVGIILYTREMDILTFGEDSAKTVGVDTNKVKTRLFLFTAILTGSAVALSGIIGFVDLIAPHVVRKIFGAKHSLVIPMSFVFGGILMVITDLISRTIISPSELPVGAITALIGAPFFAYIYFKKK